MNIETELVESLRMAIETTYQSRNYTGSILDSLHYLGNYIREKTGLQSDGVSLVGEAFGGKSPKLRVNALQTESDWNIQKGTESLLRGLFQSIRNPRSHETHTDTQQDADAIILFVNYLLGIIGASKGTFSISDFQDRVFDNSFVENVKYAQLLVEEIPPRYRFDVMVNVYRRKEEGELAKLTLFTKALLAKFEDDDLSRLAEIVSDELKNTDSNESVRLSAKMFPREIWTRLDEVAKMRSENRFIESIKEGEYIASSGKCIRGALGTWCSSIMSNFVMEGDCILALIFKLISSKREEQDYVFNFFASTLLSSVEHVDNEGIRNWVVSTLIEGMNAGDKRFYELSNSAIKYHAAFWKDSLKESFDIFQEAGEVPTDEPDDLPF